MSVKKLRRSRAGEVKGREYLYKYAKLVLADVGTYVREGSVDMAMMSLLNARRIIKEIEKQ